MQPTSEPTHYAQQPPPRRAPSGAGGWPPPGTGSWSPSRGAEPVGVPVRAARPWRVASAAFLTLLALIAALGNQGVTNSIAHHATGRTFRDNIARSVTTYQWRVRPRGGHDFAREWVSSLALVGTALVLTLLLVAVVARGKGGFWQAFIGTWMSVVVATLLGTYVAALVVDESKLGLPAASKANSVFFSPVFPASYALAAGLGVGFVVALVAGVTALASRRTKVLTAPAPSGGGPEYDRGGVGQPAPAYFPGGTGSSAAPAWSESSPWGASGDAGPSASSGGQQFAPQPDERRDDPVQHTAVLPTVDTGPEAQHAAPLPDSDRTGEETAALPRSDYPAGEPSAEPSAESPRQGRGRRPLAHQRRRRRTTVPGRPARR